MTPRNTKQGASANARRASSAKGARAASSARTPSSSATRSARTKASPAREAKPAASKPASRPKQGRTSAPSHPRGAGGCSRSWSSRIATVFVATYYPVARVQYRETRERARLRAELEGVQARNARLGTQVARLKTPEGVEDYARVQLGLVKAGEHVGVVVDDSAALPATITVALGAASRQRGGRGTAGRSVDRVPRLGLRRRVSSHARDAGESDRPIPPSSGTDPRDAEVVAAQIGRAPRDAMAGRLPLQLGLPDRDRLAVAAERRHAVSDPRLADLSLAVRAGVGGGVRRSDRRVGAARSRRPRAGETPDARRTSPYECAAPRSPAASTRARRSGSPGSATRSA